MFFVFHFSVGVLFFKILHIICEMIYHGVDNVSIVMRMINNKTTRTVKIYI